MTWDALTPIGYYEPKAKEPSLEKQILFNQEPKALASLNRSRPDFKRRHTDNIACGHWQLTRSYMTSIACYAFKAGCDDDEALWFLSGFQLAHAPDFWLTPKRLKTILSLARGRRDLILRQQQRRLQPHSIRRVKKLRKARSDRGTGPRLQQVLALMKEGLGYRHIAVRLGMAVWTAREHCRKARQIGLLPAPKTKTKKTKARLKSPLAERFFEVCRSLGNQIQVRTANGVIETLRTYAMELDLDPALDELLSEEVLSQLVGMAVRTSRTSQLRRRKNTLLRPLLQFLARVKCQNDDVLRLLTARLTRIGLPSPRRDDKGVAYRTRYLEPSAVLLAKCCLDRLRDCFTGDCDADGEQVFLYLEHLGSKRAAWVDRELFLRWRNKVVVLRSAMDPSAEPDSADPGECKRVA